MQPHTSMSMTTATTSSTPARFRASTQPGATTLWIASLTITTTRPLASTLNFSASEPNGTTA
eukprot:20513-Rhodomonas_salina.1